MNLKIAHTADLHTRRDRMDEVLASLTALRQDARNRGVDLIIVAGDTWDATASNTEASRFPEFLDAMAALADTAPVVLVYGTPSHDIAGSLEVLERLNSRYGITILRPGRAYGLTDFVYDMQAENLPDGEPRAVLFGIPEPSKEFVIANAPGIGKEAADKEIREGMQRFLFGLAALRKRYASLPAIVVYHGQIAGATLQNGQSIAAGAGLAIGRDDLAAIGADYYALGDIHLPQQIGELPAYYPGSAYPVDWGETHQCGWNLVHVGDPATDGQAFGEIPEVEPDLFSQVEREAHPGTGAASVTVERVDYPHARNQKIIARAVRDAFGIDVGDHEPVERGCRVWLEIHCAADQASQIDLQHFEDRLKLQGAVAGSRATLKPDPVETVRAADIAEKTALREKVGIYAEQSQSTIPAGALDLADQLESERERQTGCAAANIRLDRLVLRGAIGIWKGLRRDDIDVDLTKYSGLVALTGQNGRGKTTLIENFHPWPQLITREGKLADHFRLRDSRRELHFTDIASDTQYKSVILIDSQSGNGEYHLYRQEAGEWTPLTNGRKDPYVEAVEALFGSLQLFLKTAFISQKSSKASPDIQDATKGERKALFIELAGLDHLQEYAVTARSRADEIERESQTLRGRIDAKQEQVLKLPGLRAQETDLHDRVNGAESRLSDLEDRGKVLQKQQEDAREADARQARVRERIEECQRKLRELEASLATKRRDHQNAQAEASVDIPALRAEIAEIERKQQQLNALLREKSEHDEQYAQIWREYQTAVRLSTEELDQLRASARDAERLERDLASRGQMVQNQIRNLQGKLAESTGDDVCPVCEQPWPEHKREKHQAKVHALKGELEEARAEYKQLADDHARAQTNVQQANEAINAHRLPVEPETPEFPKTRELTALSDELEWVSLEAKRSGLQKAETAAQTLASIADDIQSLESEKLAIQAQKQEAERDLVPGTAQKLRDLTEQLETTRQEYAEARETVGRVRSELQYVRRSIDDAEALEAEIAADRKALDAQMATATAWRYLEAACGRDGIQALELDALAPSIAQVANELLESAYGTRFTLEFRTTRMGGSGSRQKQIEDFLVMIHDAETGDEQELKTLSGGESVWVKKAVYDAFGIIRARNLGVKFLTGFQDEADGQLDPEAKLRFFRMLEAAHAQAGRAQTVIITHTPEIQQMISQQISMGELVADYRAGGLR